jgi:uncharacterized membrane protein
MELDVAGKSAVLMDVATGTILYESNSHERLAPASVTKVMTMLLIMEAVDSGKIALTDTVTATVMTVGIGYPFVLAHGANPVVIGMLALTCGFCGTLCTPMAANFNTVPVALLDMKKPMGVIKNQVPVAIIMMVVQIVMMILLK